MENIIKNAPHDLATTFEYYKTVSTNAETIAELQLLYDHYSKLIQGADAMDFIMTDTEGKIWSLKDLKGKAVYIDIWATWCGPCCMEIPFMEKLAEHYKGNDKIEHISISLDTNDKVWKKRLEKDNPEWKQFICPDNFKSDLAQNYNIEGIPRFLFFDKEGKVISLDAPRPSSEEIIGFIDKWIN